MKEGHIPGTWRAPQALREAGLLEAVGVTEFLELPRPRYSAERQEGTDILNGHAMRDFNLLLAEAVKQSTLNGEFVLVIGGDCSILLGALAGARSKGEISLVHIDGHSDFRHPGNYDGSRTLGAAAGMDLAMATGRGETLAVDWPGVEGPLVSDERVVQLGERENRCPDFAWPDVEDTCITKIDVFDAQSIGPEKVLRKIRAVTDAEPTMPYWVHLDVDVLDASVMPAVDSPGSPGIEPSHLKHVLEPLVSDRRCMGMTLTVFDPDQDPSGKLAEYLTTFIGRLPFRT